MHMHARQKHTVGGETRKARRRMKEWEGGVSTVVVTGAPQLEGRPSRQSLVKVPEEKKKGSP